MTGLHVMGGLLLLACVGIIVAVSAEWLPLSSMIAAGVAGFFGVAMCGQREKGNEP